MMPDVTRLLFEARRWGRREKFAQAIKIYEQVLDVDEKNLEALVGMGGCHYKLGDADEARRCWEKAIDVEPKNQKVREFLDKLERGSNITLSSSSITMPEEKKKPSGEPSAGEQDKTGSSLFGNKIPILLGSALILLLVFGASFAFFMAREGGDSADNTVANRPVIADGFEPDSP
jgi:tetratricopeptide (TPR) repeat protein